MSGVLDKLILCFAVIGIAVVVAAERVPISFEEQLLNTLMRRYNPSVPPRTQNGPVQVKMGFGLSYFDFINEQEQLVLAHGWMYRTWNDYRLTWNETEYNGTRRILLNRDQIWIPDIEISSGVKVTETVNSKAMVYSDGRIRMYFSYQIESICDMDLKYFPYDTQECDFKFTSYHYSTRDLNLTQGTIYGRSKIKSAKDFNIEDFSVVREVYTPSYIAPYGFAYVTYTVSLSRASGAYSAKLVLPSVLTGFLILLTFLLPSSSYEKITLSAIVFLCLLVLMVFYHMAVPSTGETILGQYLAFALCVDFFAIIMAVVSYNLKLPSNTSSASSRPFGHMLMNGEGEAGDGEESVDHKTQMPPNPRVAWIRRYVDVIGFVVVSIIFIVGLAVILGRR